MSEDILELSAEQVWLDQLAAHYLLSKEIHGELYFEAEGDGLGPYQWHIDNDDFNHVGLHDFGCLLLNLLDNFIEYRSRNSAGAELNGTVKIRGGTLSIVWRENCFGAADGGTDCAA